MIAIRISLSALLVLTWINNHDIKTTMAMVIDASATSETTLNRSTSSLLTGTNSRKPATTRQFRIRRTRAADLDAISTMLAMEAVPSRDAWNWNDDMERLRIKSQFRQQLGHRLAAIEEGREFANRMCDVLDSTSEVDTCRLLWENAILRSKIKIAVAHSQEENAWLFHNFDQPPSSDLLNHAMVSVEKMSSGLVVGFCEVAWLPSPTNPPCSVDCDVSLMLKNNDVEAQRILASEDSLKIQLTDMPKQHLNSLCAPAIVNLVTSPSHRRMGIASRLLNFASKYTQIQWNDLDNDSSINLGLFVHPSNKVALKLYNRKGFSVLSSDGKNGLLYLTQRR